MGYGDREKARISGPVFEQDTARIQLRSLMRLRETAVQKFWLLASSKVPTHLPRCWMTLNNANTDSCLGDYSGCIVLTSRAQFVNYPLTSENATTRDESNVKRLLRYLVGNLACNKVVGSKLNVPGIASTPQGSVFVVTAADGAGDVKDRRSYSGIAVWIKGTVEDTWYPCTLVLRNRTSFVWVRVSPS